MGDSLKKRNGKGKGQLPSVSKLTRSFEGDVKPVQSDATKRKLQHTRSDKSDRKEKTKSPLPEETKYENLNIAFSEKVTVKSESKKEEPDTRKTQATKTFLITDDEKPDEDTLQRRNKIVPLKPASDKARGRTPPLKQPEYTGLVHAQNDPDEELYDTLQDPGEVPALPPDYIHPISKPEETWKKVAKKENVTGRSLPDVPLQSLPRQSSVSSEQGLYDEPMDSSGDGTGDDQNVKFGSLKLLLKEKEGLPMYDKQHMSDVKKALWTKGKNGSFVLILMQDYAEGEDPYRLIAYNNGILFDKPILRTGNKFKLPGGGNKMFLDIKKLIEYYSKNKIPETTCCLLHPARVTLR